MVMTRTQTLVQLTDELVSLLDDEAGRRGLSRSALIREAISSYLSEVGDDLERWRSGYQQVPQADLWGDLDDTTDGAARRVLRELDETEKDL